MSETSNTLQCPVCEEYIVLENTAKRIDEIIVCPNCQRRLRIADEERWNDEGHWWIEVLEEV